MLCIQLPSSFYQPRSTNNSCKSRGSSVGHSREGSSDGIDDGLGNNSRHTLSPGSSSIGNPFEINSPMINGGGIVHQRQVYNSKKFIMFFLRPAPQL